MAANITLPSLSDSDYAGRFEQLTIGTGDIGLNMWGWWLNTGNGELLQVRNLSNTLYAVEANTL